MPVFKSSTPTPILFREIWIEAQKQELGLFITCGNTNSINTELLNHRPPGLTGWTISRLSDTELAIISPGVDLDEHLA